MVCWEFAVAGRASGGCGEGVETDEVTAMAAGRGRGEGDERLSVLVAGCTGAEELGASDSVAQGGRRPQPARPGRRGEMAQIPPPEAHQRDPY